jgi:hypothetical protein
MVSREMQMLDHCAICAAHHSSTARSHSDRSCSPPPLDTTDEVIQFLHLSAAPPDMLPNHLCMVESEMPVLENCAPTYNLVFVSTIEE